MDEAAALLGHHYAIEGRVVQGAGRGRTLGFPTANLETANELIPPNGVYATFAQVDAVVHRSITNIGVRPTFGGAARTIETHLLDPTPDLYGRAVRLSFVQRLRDERRFESADALVDQIVADRRRATVRFDRLSL